MKPITEETVADLLDRYELRTKPVDARKRGANILPFRRKSRDGMMAEEREEASVNVGRGTRQRTSKGFFFYSTKG